MNDIAKLIAAAAGGAFVMHAYKAYQADQAAAAQQAALARRAPAQRVADAATGLIHDLVPQRQMQGMNGHMPMPPMGAVGGNGFYAQGMRQSAPGNPHAPVMVPSRHAGRSSAPPPPPIEPADEQGENGYEDYSADNVMGGQAF